MEAIKPPYYSLRSFYFNRQCFFGRQIKRAICALLMLIWLPISFNTLADPSEIFYPNKISNLNRINRVNKINHLGKTNNIINAFPQLQLNGVSSYSSSSSQDFWVGLYLPQLTTKRTLVFPSPEALLEQNSSPKALQFRFNAALDKSKFSQWVSERVAKYHPPEQLVFWIQPFLQLLLAIDRDLSPGDTLTFIQVPNSQTQLFFNREWLFSSQSASHFDVLLKGILGSDSQPSSLGQNLLSAGKISSATFSQYQNFSSPEYIKTNTPKNKKSNDKGIFLNASIKNTASSGKENQFANNGIPPKVQVQPSNLHQKENTMGAGPRPMLMMQYLKSLPKQAMSFTPNTRAYVTDGQDEG